MGIIYSILAGIFISLQGVFNTRLSEKVGLWGTNTIVHGLGLLVSIVILLFVRDTNLGQINIVNKMYLLGGAFGVLIVYSVMRGIILLGPAYSVSILLVTQLIIAFLIDNFGLFGVEKIAFSITKPLGILIMILGIVVFKLK